MIVKEPPKRDGTVVVRYKIPQMRKIEWYYDSLFLSYTQLFKFKIELLSNREFLDISHITPISSSRGSRANVFVFVMYSNFSVLIHEVELLLDKPREIEKLLAKAKTAENGRAFQDDISVELENEESFDVFSESKQEDDQVSGMKFYEFTEKAHSLLNNVIAGYSRLELMERKKDSLDDFLLSELVENKTLALNLLRKSKTFSSLEQMNEVITHYTPIVKSLYNYNPSGNQIVSS